MEILHGRLGPKCQINRPSRWSHRTPEGQLVSTLTPRGLVFWFSGAPTYRLCMKDMKEIMDDPGNIYSKGSEEPYGCAYKGSNKYISMFMYSFIMEKEHFACLLEFTSPKGIKMHGKYSPILKGYEQSCKFESSGEIQYKVLLGN